MKNLSIIFLSIFLESLPFILLGSLISSIIEVFVSNDKIAKLLPKNKILGSIVGVLLGFFIPACDCAVIPVSKRLLKKKVPINVAVSFMLASPIINPIVLLSTYTAFYKTNPEIFWYRLIFGIIISLIIGIILGIIYKDKDITINNSDEDHCACCKHHKDNKLISVINHTMLDMYDVLKYLMLGAFITAIFQTTIPRGVITVFNNNQVFSIITMMIFAYLISLCSTSDSFVGKSLLSQFSTTSVLAYLLVGPMIDIKNTFVLLGNYNKKFVYTLISLIFIIIFIFSIGVILI
ncbi:MAG: permease [Bacilli bacterium]|nr:permease [Bacilli bacterium]